MVVTLNRFFFQGFMKPNLKFYTLIFIVLFFSNVNILMAPEWDFKNMFSTLKLILSFIKLQLGKMHFKGHSWNAHTF